MAEWVAIGLAVIAGVVFGVRQEGRITTLAQKVKDQDEGHDDQLLGLEKLINVRFDGFDGRLERIERGMNGYLRGGSHDR